MSDRIRHIASILENIQIIRRKFAQEWLGHTDTEKAKCLHEHITSAEWTVLSAMQRNKDLTITKLAELLGMTASAATQLVDELVSKGFVTRVNNADDHRIFSLLLSPSGKQQREEIQAHHMHRFSRLLDALSDEEVAEYARLSKKITTHILKS